MAIGDVRSGISSISSNGFLNIQPPSGEEWVIHNIYHEDSVELYFSDGTNNLLFDAEQGVGYWAWYEFHVTNSRYLRVKNVTASAKLIGYDGVQTK